MDNVQVDQSAFIAALKGQRDRALDEAAMFSAATDQLKAENDALRAENERLKADGA